MGSKTLFSPVEQRARRFFAVYSKEPSVPVYTVGCANNNKTDRDTTIWKIQGELGRFERRPFVGKLVAEIIVNICRNCHQTKVTLD